MKSINKWKGGYTLIELMVTTAIFLFLLGATAPQNSNHYQQIKFDSYLRDVSILSKELQIYGASAGDYMNGIGNTDRVQGAGLHFSLSAGVTPFYDKVPAGANTNDPTASSNLMMDNGEEIHRRLSYASNVTIDRICNLTTTPGAEAGVTNFNRLCANNSADYIFMRPVSRAKVYFDGNTSRTLDNAASGALEVRFRFFNNDVPVCLLFTSNGNIQRDVPTVCSWLNTGVTTAAQNPLEPDTSGAGNGGGGTTVPLTPEEL